MPRRHSTVAKLPRRRNLVCLSFGLFISQPNTTKGAPMATSRCSFAVLATAAAVAALAAGPAIAGSLDESAADALSAQFTADGFQTTLPPVAPVQGSAPPGYNERNALPAYNKILDIADKLAPPPALYVQLTAIADHATGTGVGVDSFSSEADSKIAGATLSLHLNPPPPTATGVVPFVPLQISATGVLTDANFSVVVPSTTTVNGTTNFTNLTITGSLVGGRTLTWTGTPPVNYELFSSPEVTIVLNEQIIVATTVTCAAGQGCTVVPGGIYVKGVHVTLNKANIFGRIVSGDIYLGEAQAGS
jgi:hypothetical protein